jgi:hypothetical protein
MPNTITAQVHLERDDALALADYLRTKLATRIFPKIVIGAPFQITLTASNVPHIDAIKREMSIWLEAHQHPGVLIY